MPSTTEQASLRVVGPDEDDSPRALIAARDQLYRVGLARLLKDAGINVVAQVGSTRAAAERVPGLGLDVVVLELRRPGTAGPAVARVRRGQDPPRVLALSQAPNRGEAVEALAAGASGYLASDADPVTIAAAIRALHAGETLLPRYVANAVLAPLREGRAPAPAEQLRDMPLSERELDVLALVAKGMGNDEIARELVVTPSTVKNHMTRIVAKLGARNRTHAAVLAVHRGYI